RAKDKQHVAKRVEGNKLYLLNTVGITGASRKLWHRPAIPTPDNRIAGMEILLHHSVTMTTPDFFAERILVSCNIFSFSCVADNFLGLKIFIMRNDCLMGSFGDVLFLKWYFADNICSRQNHSPSAQHHRPSI